MKVRLTPMTRASCVRPSFRAFRMLVSLVPDDIGELTLVYGGSVTPAQCPSNRINEKKAYISMRWRID